MKRYRMKQDGLVGRSLVKLENERISEGKKLTGLQERNFGRSFKFAMPIESSIVLTAHFESWLILNLFDRPISVI